MRRFALITLTILCALLFIKAQSLDHLPSYQPAQTVTGTLRLWGHGSPGADFMGKLVKAWEDGFRRRHPGIQFDNRMCGTASAMGALYTGAGDLAILGREIWPVEIEAFEHVLHYPPLGIDIATGSLDIRNMDFALNVFVHQDNPLSKLTLAQVDAVFGSEHRRGPRNVRAWGELGLTGAWKEQKITPYGWRLEDDFATYLQEALLGGSHRWNCDLREFAHINNPDGTVYDHGRQILDALAKDRYGIAVSNLRYQNAQVKPLALAATDGGPYYAATKENLIERRYPFTRIIPAYINRAPGQPIDPKVKEFLRYILSYEGQQEITREGGYLPLSVAAAQAQLMKLE